MNAKATALGPMPLTMRAMKRSWLKRPHRSPPPAVAPISGGRGCPSLPHEDASLGHCRWCGKQTFKADGTPSLGRRLHSGNCRRNFRVAGYGYVRDGVFLRDKGVCVVCGRGHVLFGSWEADHIYPLWLVDRSQPGAWRYWTLDNLQTLCKEHHDAKSKREARDRAHIRRLRAKNPGRPVQLPLPGLA